MSHLFKFEDDFVSSLRCIPMAVRYKLDTCGVKLKLAHWNQFPLSVRQQLIQHPTETQNDINTYRNLLQDFASKYTDIPLKDLPVDSQPAWLDASQVPEAVQNKAAETHLQISVEQWEKLTPIQRFALIKLSRSNHENANFIPAMKEFNLTDAG
ncbi:nitrate reductase associated protein [Arthrospira platensis SPKY2]